MGAVQHASSPRAPAPVQVSTVELGLSGQQFSVDVVQAMPYSRGIASSAVWTIASLLFAPTIASSQCITYLTRTFLCPLLVDLTQLGRT
jgi:homoserine kinase